MQGLVNFHEPGSHLLGFGLQLGGTCLRLRPLRRKSDYLLGQSLALRLALLFFRQGGSRLRPQIVHPCTGLGEQRFHALQRRFGRAPPLFHRGQPRHLLRRPLGRGIAPLPQPGQRLLRLRHLALQFGLSPLQLPQFVLPNGNAALLLGLLARQAPQFRFTRGSALLQLEGLRIQLLQRVAGGHGLLFRLTLLVFQPFQQGSELADFPRQHRYALLFAAQGDLQFRQVAHQFAQFSLHGKRSLGALLAARDRHIVEALPGLGQEEGLWVLQRQLAPQLRIGNDVAIAQLGQDDFQRFAEAVEHANAALERHNGRGRGPASRILIYGKGKARLRILRVHQEGGAPVHIAAQQAQAFVGGVPGLHHNVVEFVAQEIFHHVLVTVFDFQEVGQHARGSQPALHAAGLKQAPHRFGGITVLCDHRLQRGPASQKGSVLGAQAVQPALAFRFGRALHFDPLPHVYNLLPQGCHPVRSGFKAQRELPARAPGSGQLVAGLRVFLLEPLYFAAQRRQPLFRLRYLVTQLSRLRHCVENQAALLLLLRFHPGQGGSGFRSLLLAALQFLLRGGDVRRRRVHHLTVRGALQLQFREALANQHRFVLADGRAFQQLGTAFLIVALTRLCPVRLQDERAHALLVLPRFRLNGVAALRALRLLRFQLLDGFALVAHFLGYERHLGFHFLALAVELGELAGQHHTQLGPHLIAQAGVALSLGSLALQRVHLSRNFFEYVIYAR